MGLWQWLGEKYIYRTAMKKGSAITGTKWKFDIDDKVPWSMYTSPNDTYGKHYKRFHLVHMIMKGRILRWVVKKFSSMFADYIEKDVPKYHYNVNLLAFERAFDDAIHDWSYCYMGASMHKNPDGGMRPMTVNEKDKIYQQYKLSRMTQMGTRADGTPKFYRPTLMTLKNMMLTVVLNDTAYSEFFNILMYKIANEMNKEYNGKDIKHLFYSSGNSAEPRYYAITKSIYDTRKNIEDIFLKEMKKDGTEINPDFPQAAKSDYDGTGTSVMNSVITPDVTIK